MIVIKDIDLLMKTPSSVLLKMQESDLTKTLNELKELNYKISLTQIALQNIKTLKDKALSH